MNLQHQTPVPPGHAVRVLFCIRANKSLYGYAYGPFRFDEERKCYVFQGRSYSVEQWEREGAELILKWYKYRPSVKVEIVKDETAVAVVEEPAVETPAPAPEPVAETVAEAPAETPAAVVVEEPAADAPAPAEAPVKRTRRSGSKAPAETPAAE